jgi:CRP-like cAMP-binding protein
MLQDSSAALLARWPLFDGVDATALETIIRLSSRRVFRPLEPIIVAGASAPTALLIVSGAGERVTSEGSGTGQIYAPGSMLGEMAMFVDTIYDSTVIAREIVEAVEISRPVLGDLLHANPPLAETFAHRIQEKLEALQLKLELLDGDLGQITVPETPSDQTQPEPAHDLKDAPSPEPRQPPASNGTSRPSPELPIHGPAVSPDLNGANLVHGSSTK